MRLVYAHCRVLGVFIGCALVATPSFAGQRGPHPMPTPASQATPAPVHPMTPVHPTVPEHPTTPVHPTTPPTHPDNPGAHPEHPADNDVHPGPVPQQIAANPKLVERLTPLLPPGMTLAAAAAGFKNQGQFIAALHVARNLDIPFATLKAAMTGTGHDSLGQAIHELRPTENSQTAARTAEHEADVDIHATVTVRTTTSPTTETQK